MGQSPEEQVRIAIYLGLPISDRKLSMEQWLFLVNKTGANIEPWLGKLLTSGGRLTLSNACLDNLPIFAMGLFRPASRRDSCEVRLPSFSFLLGGLRAEKEVTYGKLAYGL
jgi:hypothetical protein